MLRKLSIVVLLLLAAMTVSDSTHAARCYGSNPCSACSTCSSCNFCAVRGGTCGVCNPNKGKVTGPDHGTSSGDSESGDTSLAWFWYGTGGVVLVLAAGEIIRRLRKRKLF